MSITLYLKLPASIIERLPFSSALPVRFLKDTIEKLYGIPYELQRIELSDISLNDESILQDVGINDGSEITVDVDFWWAKLISLSMQGNNATLRRRVSVPMQHIDETNRVFVSLFVSATRGYPTNLVSMLSTYNAFDLKTATNVTGRTVLHAAISSGRLKCVEEIKKHAGLKFEQLLYVKDKRGCSPLNCLRNNDTRMLNYINKFMSKPVTMEEIIERGSQVPPELIGLDKENTYVVESSHDNENMTAQNKGNANTLSESNNAEKTKVNAANVSANIGKGGQGRPTKNNSSNQSNAASAPILSRPKEDVKTNAKLLEIKTAPAIDYELHSVSPLLEKTKNNTVIKIGEARDATQGNSKTLPSINSSTNNTGSSPWQRRKGSESIVIPTFPRQPRPPTREKHKPVAGKLMESSARKFSAVRRPRISSDGNVSVPKLMINQRRPQSTEGGTLASLPKQEEERSASVGKVRRISLIQNPHKTLSPSNNPGINVTTGEKNTQDKVVIEIDRDRMDKPWNSWIKAVTADADSADAQIINSGSAPEPKSRKASLQVNTARNNRKTSFDQWVFNKTQEQMVELQKLREANMHREANEAEARWKHGKSFEQWRREKEEYERLLKEQQYVDEKENIKPRKFLKGKTFEQWQKEQEEKERTDVEARKAKEAKEKEEKEKKEDKRRRESVAKYNAWLAEKDRQALERELNAKPWISKRKTSSVKSLDMKSRRKSVNQK